MFKIVKKEQLNPESCLLEIEARDIALAARAGQFIVLRVDEAGERFPLTIYARDTGGGTVTVVCQAVGVSTKKLCSLDEGDAVLDIAGPLGHPTVTERAGKVVCIGGGVGAAEVSPVAKAMKDAGNDVTAIIGARTKDLVICERDMREFCDKVHIATDDGSCGRKGLVTDILRDILDAGGYDLVFAVGPVMMMKAVADMTRQTGVRTVVSLNALMVDGTGMCGCCRVRIDGKTKFACVDGPEFDAHLVDFENLMRRSLRYGNKESIALGHFDERCRIGLGKNGRTDKT